MKALSRESTYTPGNTDASASAEKREVGRLAVANPSLLLPRPNPDATGPRTRRKVGRRDTGALERRATGGSEESS